MRIEEFREWMLAEGLDRDAARSRASNCLTIESCQHVDLDEQYDSDRCEHLIALFVYTTDDERSGRPPSHQVPINGNVRNGSATYKSSIKKYVAFRDFEAGDSLSVHRQGLSHAHRTRRRAIVRAANPNRESYQEFFDAFGILPNAVCEFGLEHSVFAEPDMALEQWRELTTALLNNARLPIRAITGNVQDREFQFYKRLNGYLFENHSLHHDCTGNYYPRRNLERAVGWHATIRPRTETGVLVNFQTSHVLSGRTHNPLLYSAVWNIAFTPKIIDPFTGDEAHGPVAEMFRTAFLSKIRARFSVCIEEYNRFVGERDIANRIGGFSDNFFDGEELSRFKDAAIRQWALV